MTFACSAQFCRHRQSKSAKPVRRGGGPNDTRTAPPPRRRLEFRLRVAFEDTHRDPPREKAMYVTGKGRSLLKVLERDGAQCGSVATQVLWARAGPTVIGALEEKRSGGSPTYSHSLTLEYANLPGGDTLPFLTAEG